MESRRARPTPRRRWCGKTNKSLICQKWPSGLVKTATIDALRKPKRQA
jgi:hypothetical protein